MKSFLDVFVTRLAAIAVQLVANSAITFSAAREAAPERSCCCGRKVDGPLR